MFVGTTPAAAQHCRLDADFDMKLSAKELDDASLVAYFKPELGSSFLH